MHVPDAVAVLDEVGSILSRFGDLRCVPTVDRDDDGTTTITIVIPSLPEHDGLRAYELAQDVAYLIGLAQTRAFFTRYGLDPAALDAMLPDRAERSDHAD